MSRARGGVKWRGCRILCLALVLGAGSAVELGTSVHAAFGDRSAAGMETQDASVVKSAFVYHFASRHVKWPESAHRDKTSPFVIGVLGKDPITAALTEFCRGRKAGERTIEVRELGSAAAAKDCHILFVPESRESELPAILDATRDRAILVVGATEDAVRKGAHIGFFLEKSKLRFAADPEAPKRAGLEVSSELLKLARVVEKKTGGPP